jgi:hypothetical protein
MSPFVSKEGTPMKKLLKRLHPERRYLTELEVCERYDVVPLTLRRWDEDPTLGFPPPLIIRGRKFRDEDELLAFDAKLVRQGRQTKARKAEAA